MNSIKVPPAFRLVAWASFASSMAVLYALATSRSSAGAVLGMWSPALAAAMTVVLVWGLFSLLLSSGCRPFLSVPGRLAGLPEALGPQLLILFPGAAFLVWFLFPVALLCRVGFVVPFFVLSFIPGGLVLFSRRGSELRKSLVGLGLMERSLAVVLAAAEIFVSSTMPRQVFNPRFGLRPYSSTQLQVDLPGITPGGTLSTNMWGFRGEDPPENWDEWLTIVTIGGSTTANYYLDDALTWSSVVQRELRLVSPRVWVGNSGIPRHSSETHLLFLQEVVSTIGPDVAVFLVGVNDMGPFLRPGGEPERMPDAGPREWLFARSGLLQLVYKMKKVHIDGAFVVSTAVDPEFTLEPMTESEAELPDDLHLMLDDPDFYRRRIGLLIDECRSQGLVPVFLTQPILYEDTPDWRGIREASAVYLGGEVPISAATFARMLNTLNGDLVEVCQGRGVAVFDLAAHVPHDSAYFYDAMHMTEAGADLAGRAVSGFLEEYLTEEGMLWQED